MALSLTENPPSTLPLGVVSNPGRVDYKLARAARPCLNHRRGVPPKAMELLATENPAQGGNLPTT